MSLDFVTATIDAFVIPDKFLETDIDMLIGQNFTELPDVIVYKNSNTLVLCSDIAKPVKAKIFITNNTSMVGLLTVDIHMDVKHTGLIYISGSTNLKGGQELIVLQGASIRSRMEKEK